MTSCLFQVSAAPKKKPKKDTTENVEDVKPASWESKACDAKGELLSDSAKARTESIKLSSVPYAKELADQLLAHASKLEALYKKIDKALDKKAGEKDYKVLVQEALELNNFTVKAQARSGEVFNAKRKIVHSIKRSTVLVLQGVENHKAKGTHSKGITARPDAKVVPSLPLTCSQYLPSCCCGGCFSRFPETSESQESEGKGQEQSREEVKN